MRHGRGPKTPRYTRHPSTSYPLTILGATFEAICEGEQGLRQPHVLHTLSRRCRRRIIPMQRVFGDFSWRFVCTRSKWYSTRIASGDMRQLFAMVETVRPFVLRDLKTRGSDKLCSSLQHGQFSWSFLALKYETCKTPARI